VKKKTAARPGLVRLWAKPRPRWRLLSIRNFAFELSHAPFELFNRTIKLLPLSPRIEVISGGVPFLTPSAFPLVA
jgi:hypothetical protein